MLLGAQLRRLRESSGVTREDAGWEIRASESKISRMELGRVGFKERDVADLLTLYGVTDDRGAGRAAHAGPRGQQPRLVAPLRRRAADLVPVVPRPGGGRRADPHLRGAVRPRPAADRGVRPRGRPARPRRGRRRTEIERRVGAADAAPAAAAPREPAAAVGGGRRGGAAPPDRRRRGDARPARRAHRGDQAAATSGCRSSRSPPAGTPPPAGAFTILRFGDQDLPDVVYIEQLTSALYLDKRDDVDYYAVAMERLCVEAEPPERTPEILGRLLDELYPA